MAFDLVHNFFFTCIRKNETRNKAETGKPKCFLLKTADIQRLQHSFTQKTGPDKKVIQNLAINSKILFLHP
jgi:hypothetical protein